MFSFTRSKQFIEAIERRLLLAATASDNQIVYHSDIAGGDITISNADGTNTHGVSVAPAFAGEPVFSPDRT